MAGGGLRHATRWLLWGGGGGGGERQPAERGRGEEGAAHVHLEHEPLRRVAVHPPPSQSTREGGKRGTGETGKRGTGKGIE